MRIFITGATGYVGEAIARACVQAGHSVAALVRSPDAAGRVRAMGIEPVPGDLRATDSLRAAVGFDALIHAAVESGPDRLRADRGAIEALIAAGTEGSAPRVLVYTSTTFLLGDAVRPADEHAPTDPSVRYSPERIEHEETVLEAATDTFATAVIRPGMVYGGGGGMVGELFRSAHREGAAAYVGSGENRWPLVHREDVGELYRLVAESRARGVYHAVDGSALPVRAVAEAASAAAGRAGAVRSIPLTEAREAFGAFADALCLDQVILSPRANQLGWAPRHPAFTTSAPAAFREWCSRHHSTLAR